MTHPFNDSLILDWLFKSNKITWTGHVVIEGYGPFNPGELTNFLRRRGLEVTPLADILPFLTQTLIIGQFGWDKSRLQNLIAARVGQALKIYSQEMFISYALTGNDPFDGSRELLGRFAEGHPALEYLMELGFGWPSTVVAGSDGAALDDIDWPKVGLLKYMGYKVGKNGIKNAQRRQRILSAIYTSDSLPFVQSHSYMAKWGEPNSCKRLRKLANSLTSFCRTAKRKDDRPELAIAHWEADLNWLYTQYYQGRCSFIWPSTHVE